MLSYLQPESRQTLRQAIAELREEDARERDVAPAFAPALQRALTAHDAVHVIFACDTSDHGEALAHAWMLLGTTVTQRELRAVMDGMDHGRVVGALGHRRRLLALCRALPSIAAAILRSRRMTRRWVWLDYDRHLDVPLAAIRHAHGIRVPTARRA